MEALRRDRRGPAQVQTAPPRGQAEDNPIGQLQPPSLTRPSASHCGRGRGGARRLCSTETEAPHHSPLPPPPSALAISELQSSAKPLEDLGSNECQTHTQNAWAHTKHSELDADLPVRVAAFVRHHASVRPRVFPGHRMESDATVREGDSVCIGGYQERGRGGRLSALRGHEKLGGGRAGRVRVRGTWAPGCSSPPGVRPRRPLHNLGHRGGGGATHP